MSPNPAIELRDFDGTYVVAEPIDTVRCRVILSNMASPGDVLVKGSRMSWKQAASDVGGGTCLPPSELFPGTHESGEENPEVIPLDESILSEGTDDEELVRNTHESIERRSQDLPIVRTVRSRISSWGDPDGDPVHQALRLLAHYLAEHEIGKGLRRVVDSCECAHFSSEGDLVLASFHTTVRSTIQAGKNRESTRIEKAVFKAYLKLTRKERKLETVAA